jgi:FkbM family methyltransferase
MWDWYKYYTAEKGETVFDLGAGGFRKLKGESMLYYSNCVGEEGVVIAVEPEINNYKWLLKIILEYQLSNVIPIFLAIGSKSSWEQINISKRISGHSLSIYSTRLLQGTRPVPVMCWDDLVDMLNIDHVDLVKANIEGAEKGLVLGMTKVLPLKIGFKLHTARRGGVKVKEMEELLNEKGYRFTKIRQEPRDTSFLAELVR